MELARVGNVVAMTIADNECTRHHMTASVRTTLGHLRSSKDNRARETRPTIPATGRKTFQWCFGGADRVDWRSFTFFQSLGLWTRDRLGQHPHGLERPAGSGEATSTALAQRAGPSAAQLLGTVPRTATGGVPAAAAAAKERSASDTARGSTGSQLATLAFDAR